MSLYQSINKIAPYVTNPYAGSPGEAAAVPFSQSYVRAKDESYQEAEKNEHPNHQQNDTGKKEKEYSFPEIFKVVDSPDFSGLFLLATGTDDSHLMMVIKKVRKQRGITDLIPVSDAKKMNQQECNKYLETGRYFSRSKGAQFTSEI